MSFRLSRRAVLRGMGGVMIGLPYLEAMSAQRAQAAVSTPTRFLAIFTANGTVPNNFFPTAEGSSFSLPPILMPLASFQSKLLVLDGVDNEVAYHGPGERHMMGMGSWLTGAQLQSGSLFSDGSGTPAGWAGGISVDQAIAQQMGGARPFKSLEFGVIPEKDPPTATVWDRMIYAGPGVPIPPMEDPVAAFNRIFNVLPPTGMTGSPNPAVLARKTILDLALGDISTLQKKLGAADRQKLASHLTALRDIESRLVTFQTGASCTKPLAPASFSFLSNDNYPQISKAMLDLIAMSFACDVTRVASLQYSYSRG